MLAILFQLDDAFSSTLYAPPSFDVDEQIYLLWQAVRAITAVIAGVLIGYLTKKSGRNDAEAVLVGVFGFGGALTIPLLL